MASAKHHSGARRGICAAALAVALTALLPFAARADKNSDAREQFTSAVRMRTMLEGYLERDRSLSDYKQTIAAYQKVYQILPQAEEVTPSLIAIAELYEEMGRLFDAKYDQSAVDTYNFLRKQYPGSRYGSVALLSIGRIEKDDLNKPDDAEAAFKEFLKRYPRSDKADEARQALAEISAQRAKTVAASEPARAPATPADAPDAQPGGADVQGQTVEPRISARGMSNVTGIRVWNAADTTKIVVSLGDTIQYGSAHIFSPDRIYFDLYKAQIGRLLASKTINVDNGLLKSARLAQNKPDVVRLVLDVSGAKDYSASLLAKPYRLVIDVRSGPAATAKASGGPRPASAGAASAAPAPALSAKADAAAPPSLTALSKPAALEPPAMPKPTHDGQHSLTRTLGLKINRIVIDPGHGGYDTGTIGPHGLMEKDLCLDVALRLGRLIEQKLPGAEVVYTRQDDTFIPLEQRTAIANQAKADLFISIHANSSHDETARGVETYYLNFATTPDAMDVAARENARSEESLHDLQDLIKKIARNDKIEESKDLAEDIQESLTQRLQLVSRSERDRGVKKAPFVVLIGADMPSVLAEISFVSNPNDERLLRRSDQRERIAAGLFHGITTYLDSLNSLSVNKQKLVSDNRIEPHAATIADTK